MPGGKLIVICGLPGSGKTTRAKALEKGLEAIRLCPDEWMHALGLDLYDGDRRGKIESLQWELGQKLLALGLTVIIEWGTWTCSDRDALRLGARALGAAAELHYLEATADTLLARIESRGREGPLIKRETLVQWQRSFQAPSADEIALFDKSSVDF